MPSKKKAMVQPRSGGFDRFQTAVVGLGWVPTAIGARFDPYTEPARHPQRSAADMEQVARVAIPGNPSR